MTDTAAECPRCAYDLSGAHAAWPPDHCPVHTTCSECGLTILWRDLLNPAYRDLDDSFENTRRHRTRAFFRTLWRSSRPWSFWKWTQMHNPPHPGRLATFIPAMLVLQAAAFIALLYILTVIGRHIFGAWLSKSWCLWPPSDLHDYSNYPDVPPGVAVLLLWPLLVPPAFILLPQTLRRARVRPVHLLRIGAYSLVILPVAFYVPALLWWFCESFVPNGYVWQSLWYSVPVVTTLLGLWLFVQWSSAARHYLKLPHAHAVAATLIAIPLLSMFVIAAVGSLASRPFLGWVFGFNPPP